MAFYVFSQLSTSVQHLQTDGRTDGRTKLNHTAGAKNMAPVSLPDCSWRLVVVDQLVTSTSDLYVPELQTLLVVIYSSILIPFIV